MRHGGILFEYMRKFAQIFTCLNMYHATSRRYDLISLTVNAGQHFILTMVFHMPTFHLNVNIFISESAFSSGLTFNIQANIL